MPGNGGRLWYIVRDVPEIDRGLQKVVENDKKCRKLAKDVKISMKIQFANVSILENSVGSRFPIQ